MVIVAVIILIIGGAIFVLQHTAVAPVNETSAWDGLGGVTNDPVYTPTKTVQEKQPTNMTPGETTPAFNFTKTLATESDDGSPTADDVNIDDLLAQLTKPTKKITASSSSITDLVKDAYAFIPTGLTSTTTPPQHRTVAQEALYSYGNEVGTTIQSFEETHKNAPQVLKDQSVDRADAQKGAQVAAIGDALIGVGNTIAHMDTVPKPIANYNTSLAQAYVDMGTKLKLVPKAQTDEQFVAAIQVYDAAVDSFAKTFVGLASYFAASGVIFGTDDAGSVFTFTNSAGLQ